MSNKQQIKIGGVYRLNQEPELGTKYVLVESLDGENVTVLLGRYSSSDKEFAKRTFIKGGIRHATAVINVNDLSEFIYKPKAEKQERKENKMSGKKQIAETHYEMDDDAKQPSLGDDFEPTEEEKAAAGMAAKGAGKKGGSAAGGAAKKSGADLKAEKAREAAKRKKEAAKQKEADRKAKEKAKKDAEAKKAKEKKDAEAAKLKEQKKAEAEKKKAADALAKVELNSEEKVELGKLEKEVRANLEKFQSAGFQIGAALSIINEKRLYRTGGQTFEQYVMSTFELSRPQAYTVMNAAKTFKALSDGRKFDAKDLPSISAAEAIHRGTMKLLKEANLNDSPEIEALSRQVARNIYDIAEQNAPRDPKTGHPVMSPAHIESVMTVLSDVAKSGAVEVDGEQIPLNIAQTSLDEMMTTESKERVERMKVALAERAAKIKESLNKSQPKQPSAGGGISGAVSSAINSTSGNGATIPEGVKPKITVICSVHSRVEIDNFVTSGLHLSCGCKFILTTVGMEFTENIPVNKVETHVSDATVGGSGAKVPAENAGNGTAAKPDEKKPADDAPKGDDSAAGGSGKDAK